MEPGDFLQFGAMGLLLATLLGVYRMADRAVTIMDARMAEFNSRLGELADRIGEYAKRDNA